MYIDSDRYPVKTFADLFFRIYGKWAAHIANLLQTLQLLMAVSLCILSNGQAISQVSKGSICFIACLIIYTVAGMFLGQIRTLQRFGWFANFAIWINLMILFIWWVLVDRTLSFRLVANVDLKYGSGFTFAAKFYRS